MFKGTRHQRELNGLMPNPHTCHKQNPPRRHRLVGGWHTAVVPISIRALLNAAIATSTTVPVVTQNHTINFASGKPHPTF